jgi:hypothetical protein
MERKTEDQPKKTSMKKSPTVIWLFALHDKIALRQHLKALYDSNTDFKPILKKAGLDAEKCSVLPIVGSMEDNKVLLSDLFDAQFSQQTAIIVPGTLDDMEEIASVFSKSVGLFLDVTEVQFYNDTNLTTPGVYKKYVDEKPAIIERLSEAFDTSIVG